MSQRRRPRNKRRAAPLTPHSRRRWLSRLGAGLWLLLLLCALLLFAASPPGQRLLADLVADLETELDLDLEWAREIARGPDLGPDRDPPHTSRPPPSASNGAHPNGTAPLFPPGYPRNFDQSKRMLMQSVYHDVRVDRYCDCRFDDRLDVSTLHCPMRTELHAARQRRIEWEHVVPASDFGRQRDCWRNPPQGRSGRQHCAATDEMFRYMEADPHNLIPVVGALNAIRSNYRFGMVSQGTEERIVAGCGFKVARASGGRFIEPPDPVKGKIARIYFYMEDRYDYRIGRPQRQLFEAWDRAYPPDAFERERNRRIHAITGVSNRFVESRD